MTTENRERGASGLILHNRLRKLRTELVHEAFSGVHAYQASKSGELLDYLITDAGDEADSYLHAAAPALLAACEEARAAVIAHGLNADHSETVELLAIIEAAIAAARAS